MEAEGDADGALAAYDGIARGRDRRARATALRRAVELRLRTGRMDAAAAAHAYAPAALVAWRGDAAERDARTRLAQLLALSGDAGGALALLRQTAALFPDGAAAARAEAARILRAALDGGASPLSAVAAFQAGSDLLTPGEREAAETRLVELLVALDLPARAAALLDGAAARAPAGDARAEIGWRLAALRFRENDAAGARAALDSTDGPEMAGALRERRAGAARSRPAGSGVALGRGAHTGRRRRGVRGPAGARRRADGRGAARGGLCAARRRRSAAGGGAGRRGTATVGRWGAAASGGGRTSGRWSGAASGGRRSAQRSVKRAAALYPASLAAAAPPKGASTRHSPSSSRAESGPSGALPPPSGESST
jgi:hypothetical protein